MKIQEHRAGILGQQMKVPAETAAMRKEVTMNLVMMNLVMMNPAMMNLAITRAAMMKPVMMLWVIQIIMAMMQRAATI